MPCHEQYGSFDLGIVAKYFCHRLQAGVSQLQFRRRSGCPRHWSEIGLAVFLNLCQRCLQDIGEELQEGRTHFLEALLERLFCAAIGHFDDLARAGNLVGDSCRASCRRTARGGGGGGGASSAKGILEQEKGEQAAERRVRAGREVLVVRLLVRVIEHSVARGQRGGAVLPRHADQEI